MYEQVGLCFLCFLLVSFPSDIEIPMLLFFLQYKGNLEVLVHMPTYNDEACQGELSLLLCFCLGEGGIRT